MSNWLMLVMIAILAFVCLCGHAQAASDSFQLLAPVDGAAVETPLAVRLKWSPIEGATSYRVEVRLAPSGRMLVDVSEPAWAIAVCPGNRYEWSVEATRAGKTVKASNAPFTFTTPDPKPKEITDRKTIFAGVHPGSHWWLMDEIPPDPSAVISPWFYKKTFDHPKPPLVEEVKDKLPRPIWDGHEDLIDMYWYAWKTLFAVWLFAPPSEDHMAVSNIIGLQTWGEWGSTMVWDTAFILQFARYGDAAYPFITGLDNCYARQHENGFICRESDRTNHEVFVIYPANPPLLAWAEWRYYEATGDKDRIRKVFLPLVKQYEWYMLYQRRNSGLYWTDAFQEADDSPRNPLAHSTVSTTSIQAMSASILAKMAVICGRRDLEEWFQGDFKKLKKMVNASFWDSENKLYNDLGADDKPITVTEKGGVCKHAHMFWPMLAGITTPSRAACLASHLSDPNSFNRASGTATLSADSNGYNRDTGSYWRGAVWPPTQYMVIKGLETCGNEGLASYLANKYVTASLEAFKVKGDITEFLEPDRHVSNGCGQFVGWGGIAPIALFIEDILGIRVDAPSNTITWRIRKLERHGIESLHLGDKTVSLICDARSSEAQPCDITVRTDGDVRLVIDLPSGRTDRRLHKGSHVIRIPRSR
ncbi:MAG: trehalase family glycosidase [Armatimonadota bacterium]|nr:trehalase family glycosidase [Armatimonadota bacterium]